MTPSESFLASADKRDVGAQPGEPQLLRIRPRRAHRDPEISALPGSPGPRPTGTAPLASRREATCCAARRFRLPGRPEAAPTAARSPHLAAALSAGRAATAASRRR